MFSNVKRSCEAFRFSVTVEVHSNRRLQSDDMSVCVLRVTFLHLNNITSYYSKQKEVIQERSSVVIGSVCPVRNSPEAGVLSLLGAAVVPVLLENTPSHMTWSLEFGLYFPTMKTLSRVVVGYTCDSAQMLCHKRAARTQYLSIFFGEQFSCVDTSHNDFTLQNNKCTDYSHL